MSAEVDEGNSASTDVGPNQQHYATKRVSFGEQQVKTFVYEQQEPESSTSSLHRTPFTRSDEPPSKVTVTSERSEIPSAILPPSVVEQVIVAPEDYHPSTGQARRLSGIITTPLPSLVRMESEHENPFRPDDELYHQVDPIVEAYKKKPYGDFPSPVKTPPPAHSSETNGKSAKDGKKDNKKDKKRSSVDTAKPKDIQYADGTDGFASDQVKRGTLNSPKAGKAELVHLEETKKRKCGCCVVQ